jgi:hypothetical protein
MAIGTSPNPIIPNTTEGLEVNRRGAMCRRRDRKTSKDPLRGGDAVTGPHRDSGVGAGKSAAMRSARLSSVKIKIEFYKTPPNFRPAFFHIEFFRVLIKFIIVNI